MQDASSNGKRATSVNVTGTITTAGANGLDTGAEAANTWYHIWVINNGTTTSALLSTSATAPTMPSGYTFKAYVGAVYNNASSNFLTFHQRGKRVVLSTYVQTLAAGTSTAFAVNSLATAVPSTAVEVFGDTGVNSSWDSFQQAGVHLAATAAGADTRRYVEYSEPTYTADQPFSFDQPLQETQNIYYKCYEKDGGCQAGGIFIRVNGWVFE